MGSDRGGKQEQPASGNAAGESLFSWHLAEGQERRFQSSSNKHNVDRPRPVAEMSRGTDGVCMTGKAMVAPCKETSCAADALKQRVRQRVRLC